MLPLTNSLIYMKTKLLYFLGGVVASVVAKKALECDAIRSTCVKGIAGGIKLNHKAMEAIQNIKESAADMCAEAQAQACELAEEAPAPKARKPTRGKA